MQALNLSHNAWYHHHKDTTETDEQIKDEIEEVLTVSPYYGYRRVTHELKRRGKHYNHKRILRIMGHYYLIQPRKRRNKPRTTNSNHQFLVYANEIQYLGTTIPNWVWVADITYVWIGNRWAYVAIVLDQVTRKVVGWAMSMSLSRHLVIEALQVALKHNPAPKYHHSDRGVQYCSYDYIDILKDNGITPSMADVGVSVDNPHAESFNRSLKVEEVYLNSYESFDEAKESIARYISCYNTTRLHSSLGYVSPCEFESHYYQTKKSFLIC